MNFKLIISITLVYFLNASVSIADSARCEIKTKKENLKNAEIVFEGKLLKRLRLPYSPELLMSEKRYRENKICGEKLLTFEVLKMIKGVSGKSVTLKSGDACIGLSLAFDKIGQRYKVFALTYRVKGDKNKPMLKDLGMCGGSKLLIN